MPGTSFKLIDVIPHLQQRGWLFRGTVSNPTTGAFQDSEHFGFGQHSFVPSGQMVMFDNGSVAKIERVDPAGIVSIEPDLTPSAGQGYTLLDKGIHPDHLFNSYIRTLFELCTIWAPIPISLVRAFHSLWGTAPLGTFSATVIPPTVSVCHAGITVPVGQTASLTPTVVLGGSDKLYVEVAYKPSASTATGSVVVRDLVTSTDMTWSGVSELITPTAGPGWNLWAGTVSGPVKEAEIRLSATGTSGNVIFASVHAVILGSYQIPMMLASSTTGYQGPHARRISRAFALSPVSSNPPGARSLLELPPVEIAQRPGGLLVLSPSPLLATASYLYERVPCAVFMTSGSGDPPNKWDQTARDTWLNTNAFDFVPIEYVKAGLMYALAEKMLVESTGTEDQAFWEREFQVSKQIYDAKEAEYGAAPRVETNPQATESARPVPTLEV